MQTIPDAYLRNLGVFYRVLGEDNRFPAGAVVSASVVTGFMGAANDIFRSVRFWTVFHFHCGGVSERIYYLQLRTRFQVLYTHLLHVARFRWSILRRRAVDAGLYCITECAWKD